MRSLPRLGFALTVAAVTLVASLIWSADNRAEARAQYSKAFAKTYPKVKAAKKTRCYVCHVGKKKKNHNAYGKALAKALPKKKTKDVKKIKKALEKVAKENKKFAEKLKKGELPVKPQKTEPKKDD